MKNELVIRTVDSLQHRPDYVRQPHAFSRSMYNLSATARKLAAMAMSLLPSNLTQRKVKFTIFEFISAVGLTRSGNLYEALENAVDECLNSKIKIYTQTGWSKAPWFSLTEFNEKTNEITMEFSELLVEYLTPFISMYAKLPLENFGKLSSKYALRFYEIAMSFESMKGKSGNPINSWYFEKSIKELREMFGIEPGAYKETRDFRVYVIEKPIKEINAANIGLLIVTKYIRSGKYLTDIRFECSLVPRKQAAPGPLFITDESREEKELDRLVKLYPEDYIQLYEEALNNPPISGVKGITEEQYAEIRARHMLRDKHGIRK